MKNSCISGLSQAGTNKIADKFDVIIPPQDIGIYSDCLERLAEGDREAYAWVYKNYSKKVYDYAMLITRNEAMSEDVVQEVFLKVWQHREKLKEVEDFNGYLYILYRNYILDVLKRQQKEKNVRQKYCQDMVAYYVTADEIISAKEKEQALSRAIKQLPSQQQLVFRLSRECGWKRDKIAKELKIAPNTVKAHIQKGLRFLREKISELPK